MRLIDVAPPNTGNSQEWQRSVNRIALACGVQVRLTDPCEDTSEEIVNDPDARGSTYKAIPFAVEALLQRSVSCARPGDEAWLEKALEDYNDFVLSRALVLSPITGTESYLGDAAVNGVTLTSTSDATIADSVMAGRKAWFKLVAGAGDRPLMHVPPSLLPALVRGGVIGADSEKSVAGDKLVSSPGYDDITSPRVFFTGPIETYVSAGAARRDEHARTNDVISVVNELVMVDIAPCTIVRVGTYAA